VGTVTVEVDVMLLSSFDPAGREFDRLLGRTFGFGWYGPALAQAGIPMDAVRREDDILLRFDLPGVDPKSIDVTVDRGVLTVTAKRDEERTEGEKPYLRERVAGSFTRRVRLGSAAETDKVEASYTDGVLTVRVPLAEAAKPRKVEVTTGSKPALAA
jgi:HSP20 family protein